MKLLIRIQYWLHRIYTWTAFWSYRGYCKLLRILGYMWWHRRKQQKAFRRLDPYMGQPGIVPIPREEALELMRRAGIEPPENF